MPKTLESRKPPTADEIADMADRGEDISRFFTNTGKMMPPIQRVNVDFTLPMLNELDGEARALNISRQAVIKTLLRHALDGWHHLARIGEKAGNVLSSIRHFRDLIGSRLLARFKCFWHRVPPLCG